MKQPFVPVGMFYKPNFDPVFAAAIERVQTECTRYNRLDPTDHAARRALLEGLLGRVGEGAVVTQPFRCDYGSNIFLGDFFYSNYNLVVLDGAKVTFGDHVFIAPNCCFTTAEHAIDPDLRRDGYEIALPITVGNNVWIGAGVTVLAGVTIGDDTVIGAGSVVTKDIPSGVVAVGVPCRVLRKISPADKTRYPMYGSRD